MDDILNIFETCHGCGEPAERGKGAPGYGECCDIPGRSLALSERERDGIQSEA